MSFKRITTAASIALVLGSGAASAQPWLSKFGSLRIYPQKHIPQIPEWPTCLPDGCLLPFLDGDALAAEVGKRSAGQRPTECIPNLPYDAR